MTNTPNQIGSFVYPNSFDPGALIPIKVWETKPIPVTEDKLAEGYKADEEKIRMDLIPPEAVEALATVLTFGAKKYADRNWEKGMKWSRPFGALMRHMWAWWKGEEKDPETGYSHLWHAMCCIAFLVTYEQRGIGTDDRK